MEPMPHERRRRGGAWWLWPLLALLLLLVLIILLVRGCGDDDGGGGAAGGTDTAQVQTNDDGEDAGDDDGAGTGDDDADGGAVAFDDLVGASNGSLAEWDGRDVEVADANVQSVVPDAGFWLGSGDDERVFVEIEDETGLDELGLQDGDSVSFNGVVERNIEAETYGLQGADAELFRRQGAHVRVQAADIEKS